jgi:hypothetical protein
LEKSSQLISKNCLPMKYLQYLLDHGVPHMPRDADGHTPLELASEEEAIGILS